MFLPVLLVRDFGIAGFLVFAIPNILGAAAMGKMLPDAAASRRFVDRHRAACAAFSIVTIIFHLFFIQWMVLRGIMPAAAVPMIGALVAVMLITVAADRGAIITAWVVFAASITAFILAALHAPHAIADLRLTGPAPTVNLVGLAAVCLLGFLLCPYLDLTFHRARQATSPAQGVIAFVAGFGGCFTAMILFTLWYSRLFDEPAGSLNSFVLHVIGLHMAVQTAFTIAAHLRCLGVEWSPPTRNGLLAGVLPAALLLMFGERAYANPETTYRLFLVFYGLIFPAYLWIGAPNLRAAGVLVAACAVAAPMYWLGFIDDRMLWLLPGVAVVLLARLLTAADCSQAPQGEAPTIYQDAESRRAL
jgi:hypothetical protein